MTANNPDYRDLNPLTQQALAFYDAELRPHLEPSHIGKYIIIDPASRDYEVDTNPVAAGVHLNDRRPGASTVAFFIGHDRPRDLTLPDNFPSANDTPEPPLRLETEADRAQRRRTAQELETYYNAKLRPHLEPAHNGHFLFIDAKSRDYEIDADFFAGSVHLEDRHPKAEMYCFHIGHNAQTSAFHGQKIASPQ